MRLPFDWGHQRIESRAARRETQAPQWMFMDNLLQMSRMKTYAPDRRIVRTRAGILEAFQGLFFEHGYDGVDVSEVAKRANVGRSTFYKHFRNKEDLLVQSLRPFLAQLAEACVTDDEPERLSFVPEHFWENRRFARVVFSGRSISSIVRALTEAIEERLSAISGAARFVFPVRLVAAEIAAAQMTLLDEWLRGRGAATSNQIASALHRSGRAIVRELLVSDEGTALLRNAGAPSVLSRQ